MAEKRFDANYTFKFNSVPFQNLFSPNQLRIDNWNKIVNQLSAQGNNLSQYLVNLNNWLFGIADISYSSEDSTGFLQDLDKRIKENLNKINTINSTLNDHTIRIDDLEGYKSYNTVEITRIKSELESHNNSINNHASELVKLNTKVDELSFIFVGTQTQYDIANAQGKIPDGTLVVIIEEALQSNFILSDGTILMTSDGNIFKAKEGN